MADSTIEFSHVSKIRATFYHMIFYNVRDNSGYCRFRTWRETQNMCTRYQCYGMCETIIHTRNEQNGWVDPARQIVLPAKTTCSRSCTVPFPHIACQHGHVTHAFLAVDRESRCFHEATSVPCDSVVGLTCDEVTAQLSVLFACRSNAQYTQYTLVCDHRQDCQDNSDEDFCFFPHCDPTAHFQCETSRECQPLTLKCNYQPDCLDASDEKDCISVDLGETTQVRPPFIVDLEGRSGFAIITEVRKPYPHCPHTHYVCLRSGNCMPIFTRCNGVFDCPRKEDERECDSYKCPGLYRCRGHFLCVLPSDLCDGVLHCPQHDDERFCNLTCPDHCTCLGFAFACRRPLDGHRVHQLRYLDAQDSGMKLKGLAENVMLIYLNLARCNIIHLSNFTLPNLKKLDLSDNKLILIGLSDLERMINLHELRLSGNPITSLFAAPHSDVRPLDSLEVMDLSRVKLQTLNLILFAPFPNLQMLNLSKGGVKVVQKSNEHEHISFPTKLREIDARGCDLTEFPHTLFQGLDNLQFVYSDTYKLCCPAVLPGRFIADNCHSPFDELSSCDALLRSNFYRGGLSVLATFGLLGNSVSFIVRLCAKKVKSRSGFSVFVQHLCISDFVMGIYLVFIGTADRLFLSKYLWQDTFWRHSAACKLAGFISLASCEVSSFIICLITVDRFLVLRFPFSQLRFGFMSAQIASLTAWAVGGTLAAVPLLPAARTWQFYSQTGICIPLPVTRQKFAGEGYAFGVMIVLNFLLFVLIAGGQVSIYASIQAGKMSEGETSAKLHDAVIARRLLAVVVSDFLCWFPVGLLGLLASSGTPIPGTVSVAMAIFVLPLNSALNPFLYTLNMLRERLQKRKEDKMLKILLEKHDSKTQRMSDK